MTNHWIDMRNADVVMAIGGNNAENHPISMKWITEAKKNGAKYIVVDPRFTRSAAVADMYAPLRSGSDIAFLGGLFNYILQNDLYHKEYVENYTTASWLVNPDYGFDDGLFTGYDDAGRKYDTATWSYQTEGETPWDTSATGAFAWVNAPGTPEFTAPVPKTPKKDPTLQDPNCVFQLMKKHYERYTPEVVSAVTGTPQDRLLEVYALYASTGEPGKSGTILYAMGMTQHTNGSQNVRAMAVTQLLLGNMGMPGGGVNALRGESNVQGSTDMALLFHIIPAYMATPTAANHSTLRAYLEKETPAGGYWTNKPKFLISLLKELYGDHATPKNDFAYDFLPKLNGKNHSHIALFEAMNEGIVKGLFLWGQNPAVGGPNCSFERKAMEKLDWMVAIDLWETETSVFWKAPSIKPADINTEVFMLPAACHYEKQGSIANSGRWIQWRWKAVDPPGDALDDAEIATEIVLALQELYKAEGGALPEAITELTWDYLDEEGHVDVTKIARAINGYTVADGKLVANFTKLAADGSTACGNWIYSGYWNNEDSMDAAEQPTGSRNNEDATRKGLGGGVGSYLGWSFAWPVNRRIIYNRASCDPDGQPWSETKVLFKWTGSEWLSNDVPDFGNKVVLPDGTSTETKPPNTTAFIMNPEGAGRLFAPGMKDGPFPEHYEPYESPTTNALSGTQNDPAVVIWESASLGTKDQYPIVMTTYRLTEHWQTGQMTRNLPWLVETMPKMFVELSHALADEKGIESGDNVVIENNRGAIKAYALVTDRFKPFEINGETVHQIGAPWHWGYSGSCSIGGIANDLTPNVGDANTMIPEYKAFLVDIRKEEV
ncbi:MAG: molybdopterin-dependent oxidoreductase [Coriobacteriia bacterium]|nr:molybdopterin-dependent oxidoreductase [Coriobacteriia bacterium]